MPEIAYSLLVDLVSLGFSVLAGVFLALQLSEKNLFRKAIFIILTISCMIFGLGFTVMHSELTLVTRILLAVRFLLVELTAALLTLCLVKSRRSQVAELDYT